MAGQGVVPRSCGSREWAVSPSSARRHFEGAQASFPDGGWLADPIASPGRWRFGNAAR